MTRHTAVPAPRPEARGRWEGPGCGHTAAEHAAAIRGALTRHGLDLEIDAAEEQAVIVFDDEEIRELAEIAELAAPSGAVS